MVIKIKKTDTFTKKIFGLIGASRPYPLLLQTRWGIHTFGLRFSIDVIVLSQKQKVVSLKVDLKPNRIFVWNPKYHCVIELPFGNIKKMNIKLGDYVELASL